LIERRRQLGIDLFDEVWEGSYHEKFGFYFDHGVDELLAIGADALTQLVTWP
jgi:hypothetical protein